MKLRLSHFIGFILLISILLNCTVYGSYKNRFNDAYQAGWIKLKNDNSFEYINWGHMTGYSYTRGSWKSVNDSIFLTVFNPKLPITNQLTEIKDENHTISIVGNDGESLIPHYIRINKIDSIKWDWDGNYSYNKYGKVKSLEIYILDDSNSQKEHLIGRFNPICDTCSYKIIIDIDKINFRIVNNLDSIWLSKKNRLYPISSSVSKLNNRRILYFKKIDSIKPINFWRNSWIDMKKGFE